MCTSLMINGEATPMGILITDGVGEGHLGMVTTFCYHNQIKMEASDGLFALHQCDLPKPSVVLVKRYTNTPYIPQGTSTFLYADVGTLSRGTSSMKFSVSLGLKCYFLMKRGRWG